MRKTLKHISPVSRGHLGVFVLVFMVAGGIIIWRSFAAGTIKNWDTQADFSGGSMSNTVATADGHVTLTPTVTSGSGTDVLLPTYEYHVEPYNYDPTGSISAGQGFYWNSYRSPSTERWVTSGNYRTLRVNGSGNSFLGSTSDYQDEWWIAWQDYFPSSFNDGASNGYMKNFHNTPGDIGWDGAPGTSGVSSVATKFYPDTNWYDLDLLDGYTADKHDFHLYQPLRNSWHSVLMHIIFGRAENGVTPKKGRVQVWVDGNNTPVLDTINSFPNGISTISRPASGANAGQLQQKITMFEGGPYNLKWQGSAPAIHQTTAMQFGTTLAGALSDTPSVVSRWGGIQIPGSPTVEAGHPDSYDFPVTSRTSSQFLVPSSLGGIGGTTAYPSSGSITLPFDAGTNSSWNSVIPVQSTPTNTSINYQYRSSTDNTSWSAWTSTLSFVPQGRYFQLKAVLSTSDSSSTPSIDSISLSYSATTASTPPVFVSSSIPDGQTLSGMVPWDVTASGSVASVEYWADGAKLFTDTAAPYSYSLDTTAMVNGTHLINVVLVGTDGSRVSAGAGGILGKVTVSNTTASKPGDLNKDGNVNITDLSILLSNYGTNNSSYDINHDGIVNILDLSILLSNYGN